MKIEVSMLPLLFLILSLAVPAQDTSVLDTLAKVEARYNTLKTMQVSYRQTYRPPGRPQISERGMLYLRKPGRMRWAYEQPEGKLFITDGKTAYLYTPAANRVEKFLLKETDDFRAPLAFLLGKLDFRRYFGKFETSTKNGERWIKAFPKEERLPYESVSMLLSDDGQIRRLIVANDDSSSLEFEFGAESRNVAIADTMFQFQMPAGVEFVDGTKEGDRR